MSDLTPKTLDALADAFAVSDGFGYPGDAAFAKAIMSHASVWAADRKDAQWKHAFDEGEVCGLMTHTADTDNPYEEASNQYCGWSFGFWSGRGIADRKRSGEFVEFLEALRQHDLGKTLHLVPDNFSIHFSAEVRRYLEKYPGIFEFHFLPTYSPWLNPMETVWREMKQAVCRNHFHRTMANLKRAVHRYFARHAVHEGALRAAA